MSFSGKKYEESDSVRRARENLLKYSTYTPSQEVNAAKTARDNNAKLKPESWAGGQYGQQLQDITNQIANRKKFTYDLNADALYQQYRDQYMNQGRLAMQDTMGQAAMLTGGYSNSYAATVGNQAYQSYLQQLNNIVPELYELALNQYNAEGDQLNNKYNILNQQNEGEYSKYRDKVNDWTNEQNRLDAAYNNERSYDRSLFDNDRSHYTDVYNNERNFDYSKYSDEYNRAFQEYQQKKSEEQAAQELALQKIKSVSSGGSSGAGGSKALSVSDMTTINKTLKEYSQAKDEASINAYLNSLSELGVSNDLLDSLYEQYKPYKSNNEIQALKSYREPRATNSGRPRYRGAQ